MKDNSIRTGQLTGMRNNVFLVEIDGKIQQISRASVSMIILDGDGARTAIQKPYLAALNQPNSGSPIMGKDNLDPIAPTISALSQTADGFRFDLEKCVKQGSKTVVCSFRATNLQPDRTLAIYASTGYDPTSYYVDDDGMKRTATSATLGTGQGVRPQTVAVTDVRVRGALNFPGVEAGVTSLAKLVIGFNIPGLADTTVEFRRVPLQGN